MPVKKYFYLLPPLLPCDSIQPYPTLPPIHFHQFLNHLLQQPPLLTQIHQLLKPKIHPQQMHLHNPL
ncbi:DNA polymerase beta superfamily protein, partial [Bacillus pumilus]|uniref:DNA polymerase beta superfamily protein n=1 Tax=Bacillus pumilus TaxID=1408 RepID=UPI0034D960E3